MYYGHLNRNTHLSSQDWGLILSSEKELSKSLMYYSYHNVIMY